MDNNYYEDFRGLWDDINESDGFPIRRPLLAHYTSLETMKCILENDTVWFSNPLYMNDFEELQFGINEGALALRQSQELADACGNSQRLNILINSFEQYIDAFDNDHVLDTYIVCFSEHDVDDYDGRLSMWRGYGANGNGAAIVFDTSKLEANAASPLVISKVDYKSKKERLSWINQKVISFAKLLENLSIPDDQLFHAAWHFLQRLILFSLVTKHRGFREEQEWRVIYMNQRDPERALASMFHYTIGHHGIEPKLKFQVTPKSGGIMADDLTLEKIIERIILGPSISNPLAKRALNRMLERLSKPALVSKVWASTTPFRPI